MASKKKLTPKQRKAIAELINHNGHKTNAAKDAGVTRETIHRWLKDPLFAQAYEDAQSHWIDLIEAAARQRAVEKSDTLAIFFLKANRPEKYDDNVRKVKYLNDNEMTDPSAEINIVFTDSDIEPGEEIQVDGVSH